MTIKYRTFSGSIYEVDEDNHRARRLTGTGAPTTRQNPDGEWQSYNWYEKLSNTSLFFCWNEQGQGTMTSAIVEVITDKIIQ